MLILDLGNQWSAFKEVRLDQLMDGDGESLSLNSIFEIDPNIENKLTRTKN